MKVSFDNFSMNMDNWFKEISSTLIEDNQTKNKILKSLKKDNEWFDENLVISKNELKKQTNIEDIALINIDKLKSQVWWFIKTWEWWINFNCKTQEIKWIFINFEIPENILDKDSKRTYFNQYYFVYNNINYIISFATSTKENIELYLKNLETINCD
jgi:hypothetical protein